MTHSTKKTLSVGTKNYQYFSLKEAKKAGLKNIDQLPKSLKVLVENLLRNQNGTTITWKDVEAIDTWVSTKKSNHEISFMPARVLMQDFTGVPAVVDLAAMREAMVKLKGNPAKINPLVPVDLVIDHSVNVDHFASKEAFEKNVQIEFEQNMERYEFLKWGQKAFKNFRVVPPGTGICHQVNLEYLAKVVWSNGDVVYPDTLVGTDSHTTMINGLSVLGWGVGGIEAEAAMLGQPVTMLIPEVVGFKLTGALPEGATATDLVLVVVQMLRKHGVVGKFVEFYGPGMSDLSLADRATLANMAPEYGATCGFFPIDEKTMEYLELSGRDSETIDLVRAYAVEQGLWSNKNDADPVFTSTLHLDLSTVKPCISGPKRPQDRIELNGAADLFGKHLNEIFRTPKSEVSSPVEGESYKLDHGSVVLAAITSCTNTSNPSVLMAAGLLAKKAVEKGLQVKPWVKTSLAPGSKVVTDYLIESGLQASLDQLGFHLVGYGCTTCIGNSGPLPAKISKSIQTQDLVACAVLSGNRNFEGRINPDIKANYLASPPLVVAYALAGSMKIDLSRDSLGKGKDGKDVFLKDIWPTNSEIQQAMSKHISRKMYRDRYADVFAGDKYWQAIKVKESDLFSWDKKSTYIQNPTFFEDLGQDNGGGFHLKNASILAKLGDSVTTDHISPAGSIKLDSPAGKYLVSHGVEKKDFNSYGSRRGNHEVMMRGTFANIRIKNEMVPGVEGGVTKFIPTNEVMPIYDAAMKYIENKTALVIVAGKEYGTGSSRDWAAKGTFLQGVKAVIVESFERIHRSNLIGMGVLPLQFKEGESRETLKLTGEEKLEIKSSGKLVPMQEFELIITRKDQTVTKTKLLSRIDTLDEVTYFASGGILAYVLKRLNEA